MGQASIEVNLQFPQTTKNMCQTNDDHFGMQKHERERNAETGILWFS